jgi:hypothetical protein
LSSYYDLIDENMGSAVTGADIDLPFTTSTCSAEGEVISDSNHIPQRVIEISGDIDVTNHLPQSPVLHPITVLGSKGEILTARLTSHVIHEIEPVTEP